MNEFKFKNWMARKNINKKVQSDMISRLKKIEREIENCDIDEQYRSDKCEYLMSLFLNMGINEKMKKHPKAKFPFGKYYISAYKYAVKNYVHFCEDYGI